MFDEEPPVPLYYSSVVFAKHNDLNSQWNSEETIDDYHHSTNKTTSTTTELLVQKGNNWTTRWKWQVVGLAWISSLLLWKQKPRPPIETIVVSHALIVIQIYYIKKQSGNKGWHGLWRDDWRNARGYMFLVFVSMIYTFPYLAYTSLKLPLLVSPYMSLRACAFWACCGLAAACSAFFTCNAICCAYSWKPT